MRCHRVNSALVHTYTGNVCLSVGALSACTVGGLSSHNNNFPLGFRVLTACLSRGLGAAEPGTWSQSRHRKSGLPSPPTDLLPAPGWSRRIHSTVSEGADPSSDEDVRVFRIRRQTFGLYFSLADGPCI
jgi:hypothetical protein